MRLMERDLGGPSSVRCVERDIRNYDRNIRAKQSGHDANDLIEHFTVEKEKNQTCISITRLICIESWFDFFGLIRS